MIISLIFLMRKKELKKLEEKSNKCEEKSIGEFFSLEKNFLDLP